MCSVNAGAGPARRALTSRRPSLPSAPTPCLATRPTTSPRCLPSWPSQAICTIADELSSTFEAERLLARLADLSARNQLPMWPTLHVRSAEGLEFVRDVRGRVGGHSCTPHTARRLRVDLPHDAEPFGAVTSPSVRMLRPRYCDDPAYSAARRRNEQNPESRISKDERVCLQVMTRHTYSL